MNWTACPSTASATAPPPKSGWPIAAPWPAPSDRRARCWSSIACAPHCGPVPPKQLSTGPARCPGARPLVGPGRTRCPRSAPLVLTCHGTDVRLLDRVSLAAVLARPVFRRARVVTTVSRHLALAIRRRTGIEIGPAEIQPMPVAAADRPWSDGSGDVVVVGRLSGAEAGQPRARRRGDRPAERTGSPAHDRRRRSRASGARASGAGAGPERRRTFCRAGSARRYTGAPLRRRPVA